MRLIHNKTPVSQEFAWNSHKNNFLLFQWRICTYCNSTFNIENQGIFYWCGCVKNEEN